MMTTNHIEDLFLNMYDESDLLNLESKYYSVNDLNNLYSDIKTKLSLSIFHTNIRSLNSNCESLIAFKNACACNFDILIISEIWSTNIIFYRRLLDNYSFHYVLPVANRAGGIAIYVKSSILLLSVLTCILILFILNRYV